MSPCSSPGRGGAGAAAIAAAALLSSGCGNEPPPSPDREEPVRRAAFRSLAARDFLLTCPAAGAGRLEADYQARRYAELRRLAAGKGAAHAIWLGENEWTGVSRYGEREPCQPGEAAYLEALAAYGAALDALAARIADFRR